MKNIRHDSWVSGDPFPVNRVMERSWQSLTKIP